MSDTQFYGRFDQQGQPEKQVKYASTGYSLAKVFGYMFVGLLITAIVAIGLGALFNYVLKGSDGVYSDATSGVLFGILFGSAIALIIMTFFINLVFLKGQHSIAVPGIVYTILMGVLLSSFVIAGLDWYLLGLAFGVTSLVFGFMALIGLLSKGSLNGLLIVGMGLIFGAGMMSLMMWIFMLLFPATFQSWYWIISLGLFAGMMFITIWDIAQIKKTAQRGELTNNLSLYLALNLYNDFIYIFIRILYFILLIFGNRR